MQLAGGLHPLQCFCKGRRGCPVVTAPLHPCRVFECGQSVPVTLAQDGLCLDHYIEQAFSRLRAALELCRQCQPVDQHTLDWLLADADFAVHVLSHSGPIHTPEQRDKLLELLLSLTNLQEYLRHHSVQVRLAG